MPKLPVLTAKKIIKIVFAQYIRDNNMKDMAEFSANI